MADTLSISVSGRPSHALVTLAGECDATTAPQLLDALTLQVPRDAGRLVIDLSGLRFIDAAGVHALLKAHSVLNLPMGCLVLAAPQWIVARMLELTGAARLIPVYEHVAETLAPD